MHVTRCTGVAVIGAGRLDDHSEAGEWDESMTGFDSQAVKGLTASKTDVQSIGPSKKSWGTEVPQQNGSNHKPVPPHLDLQSSSYLTQS